MFKLDKTTGDITCIQGDSGELFVYNAPSDSELSFSVYDKNRKIIFETKVSTNNDGGEGQNKTRIFIQSSDTDLLKVGKNEDFTEYYYGIKLTQRIDGDHIEKTYLIGNSTIDDLNTLYVYPKRTEGDNDL